MTDRTTVFIWDTVLTKGDLAEFQAAWAADPPPLGPNVCARVAVFGHLPILQWVREQGCAWDVYTSFNAAYGGHLEMLKWVLRCDPPCPWSQYTLSWVAERGHLNVLQWIRESGLPCEWHRGVSAFAADGGHLKVLQWLRAQTPPCPWDHSVCSNAAANGHLEVLQWARANGCPWDGRACVIAAQGNHLEVLQWLMAAGCPGKATQLVTAAWESCSWTTLQWLLQTYPSTVLQGNASPNTQWPYHYAARQWLTRHHNLRFPAEIRYWLAVVDDIVLHLEQHFLCRDLAGLVETYV